MKYSIGLIGIITCIFMAAPMAMNAQKSKLKLAQKSYDSFDYFTSAQICKDILSSEKHKDDTTALRIVADCQRNMGQYAMAEGYLKQLISLPGQHSMDRMNLASILKIQKKYKEAMEVYRLLAADPLFGDIASEYLNNEEFAVQIIRDSSIYSISNSNVNSASSDFAPSFFDGNKVIFSSARGQGIGGKKMYNWNQQPYLNIYEAPIQADSTLGEASLLQGPLNTRYHEGTATYDPITRIMYFTRNNYLNGRAKRSKTGRFNLAIEISKFDVEGNWGKVRELELSSPEYSVGHPSVSNKGKRLWFTSDKPGGLGGTDIYYSEEVNGTWTEPKNAGPKINTSGNEMFPFVARDTVLYFSSDGRVGLGGLDLFFIDITSDDAVALNMGYPANSSFDDFGAVVFNNECYGYFSSDRPGGKGDDDIYEFKIHPPDTVIISGTLTDEETLQPIELGLITVHNLDGSVSSILTNKKGQYVLRAPWRDRLRIEAEKKDYIPSSVELKTSPRSAYLENADLKMRKLEYGAAGKVLLAENNQPAKGATVKLYEMDGTLVETATTQGDGAYFFALEKGKSYIVEASKEGYITLSTEVNSKNPASKIYYYDFKIFIPEIGTIVRLDNIYYDYNKADIRPDAAKELDKLVKILKDNPTMKIELGSHSDSRGSDSYNLTLSSKRAESAVKYLISQGIASSRLVAKGYGETKILNRCVNGVDCLDEEHQYNRRTEFMILDI